MTVTRPGGCAAGIVIVPARTRGIELAVRRWIGWNARRGSRRPSASAASTTRTGGRRRTGAADVAPLESPRAGTLRGQARARPRRRQQALDRMGDRAAARGRGRAARVHLPGRADREERARARGDRVEPARDDLRRPLGRRRRARLRARSREAFGGELDLLVHSVAFAAAEDLEGRFTDTPRDRFWLALDVSAYSLVAAPRAAEPLMEAAGGGSIVTMTYLGGERAVPHYNVMGVAKATLDASVKYLAWDLGAEEHPRQRGLGRPGAHARGALDRRLHRRWRRSSRSARRSAATSTPTTSPRPPPTCSRTTRRTSPATTLYVDAGYHAMGM